MEEEGEDGVGRKWEDGRRLSPLAELSGDWSALILIRGGTAVGRGWPRVFELKRRREKIFLPRPRLPTWVRLSNWTYHCLSQTKPLLLMSSHFAVQSRTLLPSCARLSAFVFPLWSLPPACRAAAVIFRNKPSSLLLPSVLRWDEVTLRYMSSFVGKTMAGFLSFFFFLSPEAEIPSSFCHNKGDRGGKWKRAAPRERGEEERRCDGRGGGADILYNVGSVKRFRKHSQVTWHHNRGMEGRGWCHLHRNQAGQTPEHSKLQPFCFLAGEKPPVQLKSSTGLLVSAHDWQLQADLSRLFKFPERTTSTTLRLSLNIWLVRASSAFRTHSSPGEAEEQKKAKHLDLVGLYRGNGWRIPAVSPLRWAAGDSTQASLCTLKNH